MKRPIKPSSTPDGSPSPPTAEAISLHGHDPEEVLRALLQVDPDSEPVSGEQKPQADDGRCTVEGWGAGRVERCRLPAEHLGVHQYG